VWAEASEGKDAVDGAHSLPLLSMVGDTFH
jgi:hypothetical protein